MPKTIYTFPPGRLLAGNSNMEAPKTKKGGRPPKTAQEKKSFKIELRLSQQDHDKLEKQFQHADYRNRSDMYYDMLFHQSLRQKDSDTLLVLHVLQDLCREIKDLAASYRQAAARLGTFPPEASLAQQLQQLTSLTAALRDQEKEMFAIIIRLREKWLRAS